jgi:hypothetical protein
MKKQKGRPRKYSDISLTKLSEKYNVNNLNIYPIRNYGTSDIISQNLISEPKDRLVCHIELDSATEFTNALHSLRKKGNLDGIHIDETGFLIFSNGQSDIAFECKLFYNKVPVFKTIKGIDFKCLIDLDKLDSTIKNKKDQKMIIDVYESKDNEAPKFIKITNESDSVVQSSGQDLTPMIAYMPNNVTTDKYDCIFVMEASEFHNAFKKAKKTSDIIEIIYKDETVTFACVDKNNKQNNSDQYRKSEKLVFLAASGPISIKAKLTPLVKFLSGNKYSYMVKVYLSNRHGMIIEYNIIPGYGAVQIFVKQHLSIKI